MDRIVVFFVIVFLFSAIYICGYVIVSLRRKKACPRCGELSLELSTTVEGDRYVFYLRDCKAKGCGLSQRRKVRVGASQEEIDAAPWEENVPIRIRC